VMYTIIRGLAGIVFPVMLMCSDAITLSVARTNNAEYNFQKFYGSLGGVMSPVLVGILMDRSSRGTGKTDFSSGFYLFAATQLMCIMVLRFIKDAPAKKEGHKGTGDASASALFKNPAVFAFLVLAFLGGVYWSFTDTFCILFLEELGASKSFFGLRAGVAGMTGIVATFFGGFIIQKVGSANLFATSMMFYFVRLMVYSFAQDPTHVLIVEVTEGVTFVLFIVNLTTYMVKITPPSLMGSVQGMVMGLFMGLGRASGSLVGGVLTSYLGSRATFQLLGVVALLAGLSYLSLYNSWLKNVEPKYDQKKDENKEKKKE